MSEHGYRIVQIVAAPAGLEARYAWPRRVDDDGPAYWSERVDVVALVETYMHPTIPDGEQEIRALELVAAQDDAPGHWVDHTERANHFRDKDDA